MYVEFWLIFIQSVSCLHILSEERDVSMKPSVLIGIIQRLNSMMASENNEEVRRFEVEGVEKCIVKYIKESDSFEMTDRESDTTYQFDDIDLVAIEIYETLA